MYEEADLLPLSGLQHFTFCERRWALVQIEQQWEDNRFTAEGSLLHERAHSGSIESRPGVLVRRTLPLRSLRLGLSGQADIVEFVATKDGSGIELEGRAGRWRPFPVEYKRKKDHARSNAFKVQLCGQAMCLEEMFEIPVSEGAVYDGTSRRRQLVSFTPDLRLAVEKAAERMHVLFREGITPSPILKKACQSCSLINECQPRASSHSASDYLQHMLKHAT